MYDDGILETRVTPCVNLLLLLKRLCFLRLDSPAIMPLFDPAEHEARIAAMERLNKSLEARKPKLAWGESALDTDAMSRTISRLPVDDSSASASGSKSVIFGIRDRGSFRRGGSTSTFAPCEASAWRSRRRPSSRRSRFARWVLPARAHS